MNLVSSRIIDSSNSSQQDADNQIGTQLDSSQANNIHSWARKFFKNTTQQYRIKFAIDFFFDALEYRLYKINLQEIAKNSQLQDSDPLSQSGWKIWSLRLYRFQSSNLWRYFMLTLSYIMMYIICLSSVRPQPIQFAIQVSILVFLWLDIVIQRFYRFVMTGLLFGRHFSRFYIKLITVCLLTLDQILIFFRGQNDLRPLLIVRCVLPFLYGTSTRKKSLSFLKLYKVFFMYNIIFSVILIVFSFISNAILQDVQRTQDMNKMSQNFFDLLPTFMIFNVFASHESYPDYQIKIMKQSTQFIILCVIFLFLNVHVFLIIPSGTFYYDLRQINSKDILFNQLHQQHSLIFAYMALSYGQKRKKLSKKKLIQFLFELYHRKVQYIGYITKVCRKINCNETMHIQISQFINLCKIMQSNSSMLPNKFQQNVVWRRVRDFFDQKFKLKTVVNTYRFKLVVVILIILSIINCMFAFFNDQAAIFIYIGNFFTVVFIIEIIMKILGLGAQRFFKDTFHMLDFFLVFIMLIFLVFSQTLHDYSLDEVVKIIRFYRVPVLGKQLANRKQFINQNSLFVLSARLTNQLMIIAPLIVDFIPFYLVSTYFLGIVGMWLYKDPPNKPEQQYSNFSQFLYTQFFFVQCIAQAGWATIMFHYSYIYGYTFTTSFYFLFCHVFFTSFYQNIVKSIVWQTYATVHQQLDHKAQKMLYKEITTKNLNAKRNQLILYNIQFRKLKQIPASLSFTNTLTYRRILEQNKDLQIRYYLKDHFGRMNNININLMSKKPGKYKGKRWLSFESQSNQGEDKNYFQHNYRRIVQRIHNQQGLEDIQDFLQEDVELQINQLCKKYSFKGEVYVYDSKIGKYFERWLQRNMIIAQNHQIWFDEDSNLIGSPQTIRNIQFQLYNSLNIKSHKREQIIQNIKSNLIQNNIPFQEQYFHKKRIYQTKSIDTDPVLRQTFLSGTSQFQVQKFYMQQMSKTYPKYFNQIVQIRLLEPFLRWEARALYTLRNILRYRQIGQRQFFNLLLNVERIICQKVLRRGSIFKFVFQLSGQLDYWFTIQPKQYKQYHIRFIKNNIWLHNPNHQQNTIYNIKDVFLMNRQDQPRLKPQQFQMGVQMMRMLFQNFQTLAIGLKCREQFFKEDPTNKIYGAFVTYKNVDITQSQKQLKIPKISKIMTVILANQGQRYQSLNYFLTKIDRVVNEQDNIQKANVNQDEASNIKDLKQKETVQDQILTLNNGLPFVFIVDMMVQISDIMKHNSQNFAYQLQGLLRKSLIKL